MNEKINLSIISKARCPRKKGIFSQGGNKIIILTMFFQE
jgi:hypothetical protein